jgi:hypothetical protein
MSPQDCRRSSAVSGKGSVEVLNLREGKTPRASIKAGVRFGLRLPKSGSAVVTSYCVPSLKYGQGLVCVYAGSCESYSPPLCLLTCAFFDLWNILSTYGYASGAGLCFHNLWPAVNEYLHKVLRTQYWVHAQCNSGMSSC